MKSLKYGLLTITLLQTLCSAASISIDIQSGGTSLRDELGNPLSGGNPGVNGDGTQVLLGYYADSAPATPFGSAGIDAISSFVALTGPSSPFGINFTVGDAVSNTTGNGELFLDAFSISTGIADEILPSAGKPLVVRFFNTAQTFVLDVSNTSGLWNWQTPAVVAPTVSINFDDAGLVVRGVGQNNRTTLAAGPSPQTLNPTAAPEPTSAALMMVGLLSFAARRRRQAN